MKKTELEKAYNTVFYDLMQMNCGLLVGKYDAANGSDEFMHGVHMVMELIAAKADEDYFEFSDMFTRNMIASQEKAKGIKCHRCAELSGCWKGQHGGKKNCKCFSPKGVDK